MFHQRYTFLFTMVYKTTLFFLLVWIPKNHTAQTNLQKLRYIYVNEDERDLLHSAKQGKMAAI